MFSASVSIFFFDLLLISSFRIGEQIDGDRLIDYLNIENCTLEAKLQPDAWNLLLLHNNDMHSRFVETDAKQDECSREIKEENKCYGGFARIATVVREARKRTIYGGPPILFLNSGDTFAGTPWFMVHKAPFVARSLNLIQPDAISLGNHEFDLGASGIETMLSLISGFPILSANIDVSEEAGLRFRCNLKKSVIFNVNDRRIAVIGYILPEVKLMATANNITFYDEIPAIRSEIKRLKAEGIEIFIALGHSGIEMDKKIAEEVEDIDIVIGGHTHTFLWNGEPPDLEKPKGPYPLLVKQDSGRIVPVVQTFSNTKYLGRLLVTFDGNGEVIEFCGQPLLLDNKVPQAPDVVEFMRKYKPAVDAVVNEVIGKSISLPISDCRKRECDIGNLVARSLVHSVVNESWGDDVLALQNAGSIRIPLELGEDGSVNYGTIMTVLPYGSTMVKCRITGEQLKKTLEWGVARYIKDNVYGEFPQVANMKVTFDLSKEVGNRVEEVLVKCKTCSEDYVPLEANKTYILITTSYVAQQGDGYVVMKDVDKENLGILDTQALADYMKENSPIDEAFLSTLRGNIIIAKEME